MPQVTQHHKPKLSRRWQIVLAVVVIGGGFAVGFIAYRQHLAQAHQAVQQAIDESQRLIGQRHYSSALAKINAAAPSAQNKSDQLNIIYYRAVIYLAQGDNSAARDQFKMYEKLNGLTPDIAHQLAYTAERTGRKGEAIAYYQKAIDLTKKSDDHLRDQKVIEFQSDIAALEQSK